MHTVTGGTVERKMKRRKWEKKDGLNEHIPKTKISKLRAETVGNKIIFDLHIIVMILTFKLFVFKATKHLH